MAPLRRSAGVLLFVAPLVGAVACGEGAGSPYPELLRIDSAGVEIVVDPGGDVELPWRFEPLFALGGRDEGPGSFYWVDRSMVGTDARGRIYVLTGTRVEVYELDGSLARVLGREGEGPGELARGNALAVAPEGEVAVFDFGKAALVRFAPDGSVLPQLRLERPPEQDGQRRLGTLDGAFLVSEGRIRPEGAGAEVRLLFRSGEEGDEGELVAAVSRPPGEMVRYDRCGGGLRQPPVFAPELVWDARGPRVVWNDAPGYRLELRAGEEELRSIRRELPALRATRELAENELGEGMTFRFGPAAEPCTISPVELVDGRGFVPEAQWIRWVVLGPEGGLWVLRREVESDKVRERVDVFAPDGAYLGTLPEGTPVPILALPGDRVAFVETGELDVQRLVVARVIRDQG